MSEQWKIINGCSGYMVSEHGRVKNIKNGKILKGSVRQGYISHTIRRDNGKMTTFSTHILVARAFVFNDDVINKTLVNHIDENKTNPVASNLEWVTCKENSNHGTSQLRIGLSKQKPINEYDVNGKYIRTWRYAGWVEKIYPVTARNIQMSIMRNGRTGYGRQWRYLKGDDISDIEPITNKYVLKYLPNDDYDYEIPSEYLYTVKKLSGAELMADKLDEIIHSSDVPMYFVADLKNVREYLLKQCC